MYKTRIFKIYEYYSPRDTPKYDNSEVRQKRFESYKLYNIYPKYVPNKHKFWISSIGCFYIFYWSLLQKPFCSQSLLGIKRINYQIQLFFFYILFTNRFNFEFDRTRSKPGTVERFFFSVSNFESLTENNKPTTIIVLKWNINFGIVYERHPPSFPSPYVVAPVTLADDRNQFLSPFMDHELSESHPLPLPTRQTCA